MDNKKKENENIVRERVETEYNYTSPLHFGKVIGKSATTNNTSSITLHLPYAETPNIELITL